MVQVDSFSLAYLFCFFTNSNPCIQKCGNLIISRQMGFTFANICVQTHQKRVVLELLVENLFYPSQTAWLNFFYRKKRGLEFLPLDVEFRPRSKAFVKGPVIACWIFSLFSLSWRGREEFSSCPMEKVPADISFKWHHALKVSPGNLAFISTSILFFILWREQ